MLKWICRVFGHRRASGWWGDGLYGEVIAHGVDGIGRSHYSVWNTCNRCGARYRLARFHGHQVSEIKP